jgi:predicted nuclease with TOPRIM domain
MVKEIEKIAAQLDEAVKMATDLRLLIVTQQQELGTVAKRLDDLETDVTQLRELTTKVALIEQSLSQLEDTKKRWWPIILAVMSSALLGGSAPDVIKALLGAAG